MGFRSACADLTPERLCSADPSARSLLEAGLRLLPLIEERAPPDWLSWLGGPRGVSRCATALDDEGTLVFHEDLGDARLPYGRDIRADTRIRALDRDLAEAASARSGLAVAPEPPSAPAASASAPLALLPPSCGRVSRPAFVSRMASRPARPRRAYPLGGSGGTTATLGGPPGPPLEPLPLFTWDGSAQFGTPSPFNPAIWSSLGRSLGELPSILNNGVDLTLIMALSRTLVRLRNEVAAIVSRPLGERDVVPLYQVDTVETLRRYLTEEYGTAVVDTNTVVAGWSLRNLSASSAPPRGVALPAAPRRPPSPPRPIMGRALVLLTPTMGQAPVLLPTPLMGRAPVLLPEPPMGRAPVLPLKPYMGLRRVPRRTRRRTRGRITMRPSPKRIVARTMILAMGPVLGVGDLVTLG